MGSLEHADASLDNVQGRKTSRLELAKVDRRGSQPQKSTGSNNGQHKCMEIISISTHNTGPVAFGGLQGQNEGSKQKKVSLEESEEEQARE